MQHSSLGHALGSSAMTLASFWSLLSQHTHQQVSALAASLLRLLWMNRNAITHGESAMATTTLWVKGLVLMDEQGDKHKPERVFADLSSSRKWSASNSAAKFWRKPDHGFLKINSDASIGPPGLVHLISKSRSSIKGHFFLHERRIGFMSRLLCVAGSHFALWLLGCYSVFASSTERKLWVGPLFTMAESSSHWFPRGWALFSPTWVSISLAMALINCLDLPMWLLLT